MHCAILAGTFWTVAMCDARQRVSQSAGVQRISHWGGVCLNVFLFVKVSGQYVLQIGDAVFVLNQPS